MLHIVTGRLPDAASIENMTFFAFANHIDSLPLGCAY